MRRSAAVVVATMVASGFLILGAAAAVAAYDVAGTFANAGPGEGGQGSGQGEISNANQIDVNDATGNLYVADTGNNRIEVFKPTSTGGEFDAELGLTGPTGLAIDQDGGDVYVSTPTGISKYTVGLTPADDWTDPGVTGALAVDPATGDLLVADTPGNQILRFDSDGTADGGFAAERPVDVAANSAGEVFVVTSDGNIAGPPCGSTSAVERFSAAGVSAGELASLTVPGSVAVDPDDDTIVVAAKVNEYFCEQSNRPEVVFFDADGTFGEAVLLPQNAYWAAVPGLTAQGGGSSRVYALTRSPVNDQYGATGIHLLNETIAPTVTIAAPDSITQTGARLSGTVDPLGVPAGYEFEYRPAGDSGWTPVPGGSGDAGSGSGPVERQATLGGLLPNSAYEARLTVSNSFGTVSTEPVEFKTLSAAPSAQTLPAGQVGQGSALLRAAIDPAGEPTSYYFEYGLDASYGARVPAASRSAGGDQGFRVVSSAVAGLQANTVYHYRVVAENGTGVTLGEDVSFRTAATPAGCANEPIRERQGSQFLPECRAYELVSPPDKNGYDVSAAEHSEYSEDFTPMTSVSGDAVAFTAHGTFAGAPSNSTYNTFLARRDAGGWSTTTLTPYVDYGTAQIPFQAFTDDLRSWYMRGPIRPQLTPGGGERVFNGYFFDGDSGRYELTTPGLTQPPDTLIGDPAPEIGGWSADQETIFINISNGPVGEQINRWLLFEWNRDAKQLRPVGGEPGAGLPLDGETVIASPDIRWSARDEVESQWNPVSEDGSTVFYYLQDVLELGEPSEPQLYVEVDGSSQHVSAPQRSEPDPNGTQPATYHWASSDGSVAFFSSGEKLTEDATTGPLSEGNDLYRYDVASEALTDITVDSAAADGAEVQGVIGGSDDGRTVYFVARGELAPGALAGADNLYRWTDDGSAKGAIAFVSTGVEESNWLRLPGDKQNRRTARVSGDGEHVLFTSRARLSDYDNAGHSEAYLYDAATEQLRCASCNPSGATATADARAIGTGDRVAQARTLSDGGRFVFFSTTEGLVPTDVNNRLDTYRYDATADRIDLISPGTGPFAAEFQDASADGSVVYFTTRQSLLSIDSDTSVDVYGARAGGGFLSQSPPPAPVPCVGEACRPEPAVPPPAPSESSAVLNGHGNASEGRAKKGKKRPAKCAKAKRGKKGKAKACGSKKTKKKGSR